MNLHGVVSAVAVGPAKWSEVALLRGFGRAGPRRAASLRARFRERLGPKRARKCRDPGRRPVSPACDVSRPTRFSSSRGLGRFRRCCGGPALKLLAQDAPPGSVIRSGRHVVDYLIEGPCGGIIDRRGCLLRLQVLARRQPPDVDYRLHPRRRRQFLPRLPSPPAPELVHPAFPVTNGRGLATRPRLLVAVALQRPLLRGPELESILATVKRVALVEVVAEVSELAPQSSGVVDNPALEILVQVVANASRPGSRLMAVRHSGHV